MHILTNQKTIDDRIFVCIFLTNQKTINVEYLCMFCTLIDLLIVEYFVHIFLVSTKDMSIDYLCIDYLCIDYC